MNKIKVGDKFKTRDGQDVVITSVLDEFAHMYPIAGMLNGLFYVWRKNGKYYRHEEKSDLDLIIPDQPEETPASQYIGHVTEVEIMNGTELSAKVTVFDEGAATVDIKTCVNASEWSALSAAVLAALKSMNLEGDK